MLLGIGAALAQMLSTTAFAIEESDVEAAINASSAEAVSGNVFIWFLCALAFLKISQKIDSFMSSLGVNVGRTGGSMLGELMIAGRALGATAKATVVLSVTSSEVAVVDRPEVRVVKQPNRPQARTLPTAKVLQASP